MRRIFFYPAGYWNRSTPSRLAFCSGHLRVNVNLSDGSGDPIHGDMVVGGTGAFEGATGIWVGLTQGQGKVSEVAPGRKLPQSILKLMNGYVRLPVK